MRRGLLLLVCALLFSSAGHCEVKYAAEDSRDPFFGDSGVAAAPTTPVEVWVLDGLLWAPPRSQALIGGQRVRVGDFINAAQVTKIDKNSVELLRAGKKGILTKKGIQWTAENA